MMLQKLKCRLGYHDFQDTGVRYGCGFIEIHDCKHCGAQMEVIPSNVTLVDFKEGDVVVIEKEGESTLVIQHGEDKMVEGTDDIDGS